jgi:hypothetical protein
MSIFINYRRNDLDGMAGRIYDRLKKQFSVFLDTENREENIGNDFPARLKGAIETSSIVLVLFGKDAYKEFQARINKNDWVEEEIIYAKKLGKKIIPVLIGINSIPEYLPKTIQFLHNNDNYLIRHDYFDQDIENLKKILTNILEEKKKTTDNNEINFNDVKNILTLSGEQGIFKVSGSIEDGYELWQSEDDFDSRYFMSIFKQKFDTASKIEAIDFKKYNINKVVILYLRNDDIDTIKTILEANNIRVKLYTYNQFIGEKCIGNRLPKINDNYYEVEYYIEQNLYSYSKNNSIQEYNSDTVVGLSGTIISNFLTSNTKKPLMLILANPGAGKTTFINHLLANREEENYNKKYFIIIYAEKLKGKQINFYNENRISTIYDLYKLYTHSIEGISIEEKLFNIGLASGNIVIIIEGLDEILSLFPNRFDINTFFESLIRLNKEFGECKVITTSRFAGFENSLILENSSISTYALKGFNSEQIDLYLKKRYSNHPSKEEKVATIKATINDYGCALDTKIPFLISLLCEIDESSNSMDTSIDIEGIPYLNFNEPFDYIFYYDLQREKARQGYNINVKEILEILKKIALNFGKVAEYNDIINSDICDVDTLVKIKKMRYIQSIGINQDSFMFSSDFVFNYLVELAFIDFFSKKDIQISNKLLNRLTTLNRGIGSIQENIVKYFQDKKNIFMHKAKATIQSFIETLNKDDLQKNINEWKFRKNEKIGRIQYAISAILYMAIDIHGKTNRDEKLKIIKELYSLPDDSVVLQNIYINGAFYEVNFENIRIEKSLFDGYENFANSINNKTIFINVEFQNMEKITGLTREKFPELEKQFQNCDLHCLKNNFYFKKEDSEGDLKSILSELFGNGYVISKDEKHALNKIKCLQKIVLVEEMDQKYKYTLKDEYREKARNFYNHGITLPIINEILYCLQNK